ncbi:MAG: hypothetical protein JXB10_19820 [Pirellulales bacterium]|nr:hypothetical protein [Pirellulales bacterium]
MPHDHDSTTPCCPPFDPAVWDSKTVSWNEKPFIKDSLRLFFHIPWPPTIGRLMKRMWEKAQRANAAPDLSDFLVLAYDPSPWRGEYYMAVTNRVPDAENITISGTFFTKVFDGPFRDVPKWIKAMDVYVADRGQKTKKYYFHYTTCPKCAKIYGHNYVVAFAQIS